MHRKRRREAPKAASPAEELGARVGQNSSPSPGGNSEDRGAGPEEEGDIPGHDKRGSLRWLKDPNTVIAMGTVFLGLLGAVSLWLTRQSLKESRREFVSSFRENQRDFQASERPVLALGRRDGTIAQLVVPGAKSVDPDVGLKVYVQNGGPSSALTPNLRILWPPIIFYSKGQKPMRALPPPPWARNTSHLVRYRNKDGSIEATGTSGPITSQSERVYFFPDLLTKGEYDSMITGGRLMLLRGFYEYCDSFGKYRCQEFTLDYQGAPFDAFSVIGSFDCSTMYHHPAKAAPGVRYLPPCEQPVEREASQKRERAVRSGGAEPGAVAPLVPTHGRH